MFSAIHALDKTKKNQASSKNYDQNNKWSLKKPNTTLTNNIQRKQTLSGPNCIFIAYHIIV